MGRGWTREGVVAALREVARERGESVGLVEFCAASGISVFTVHRHCGGWLALREAAGLRPERRRPRGRYSREGMREALVEVAGARGGRVTLAEFCRATGISGSTVERHWGSWTALQRASGVPANRRRSKWSDEDLLREYGRVVNVLGRIPKEAEFNRLGRCSWRTLAMRFGGKREVKRRFGRYLMGLAGERSKSG